VEICMARADLRAWPSGLPAGNGPLPGLFKKYRQGTFSTTGIGGADTPVVQAPTALSNTLEGHVAYSKSLGKYLMVYGVDAWEERTRTRKAKVSGLYVAYSDDGLAWRRSPEPLIRDFGVAYPGLSVSWEGSILWDKDSDTQGWLVYGHSPDFSAAPHNLEGRRIKLVK
jgi:hypothetical protein